jgi:predicted GNAT family acetyltransferase
MDLDNINLEALKDLNAEELINMMPNDTEKDTKEFTSNFERVIMSKGYDQDGNALILEGEKIYILTTDGEEEEQPKGVLVDLVAPLAANMPFMQEEETKNKVLEIVHTAIQGQIEKQGNALAFVWGFGFMIDTGKEFKPVQISDIIEKKSIIPLILGGLTEEEKQEEEEPETPTNTEPEED